MSLTKKIWWFEILFVILNCLVVILFYQKIYLATVLLFLISLIGLFKWRSLRTFVVFLLVGIIAPFIESLCIFFGIWNYSFPNFINFPFWLFVLWGNAGMAIYQVAKKIKERKLINTPHIKSKKRKK